MKAYSTPVRIVAIASVMMNELPRSTATRKPLVRPATTPSPSPSPTATGQATPHSVIATTAAPSARPTIEPIERSKSCIASTTVRPRATIIPGAAAVRIDSAFAHVGNVFGRARLNARIIRPNAISTP